MILPWEMRREEWRMWPLLQSTTERDKYHCHFADEKIETQEIKMFCLNYATSQ